MKNRFIEHGPWHADVIPDRKVVPEVFADKSFRNEVLVPGRKEAVGCWSDDLVGRRNLDWAWMADRLNYARELYVESVGTNPLIRGGVPVVKGTRVPIALVLANLANNMSVNEVADDLDLDESKLKAFLKCISIAFDRPSNEYHPTR